MTYNWHNTKFMDVTHWCNELNFQFSEWDHLIILLQ